MRTNGCLAAAVAAAVLAAPAGLAQDLGFVSVRRVAPGTTNQGAIGALDSTGLLGTATGDLPTGLNYLDVAAIGNRLVAVAEDGAGSSFLFRMISLGDGTVGFPRVTQFDGTAACLSDSGAGLVVGGAGMAPSTGDPTLGPGAAIFTSTLLFDVEISEPGTVFQAQSVHLPGTPSSLAAPPLYEEFDPAFAATCPETDLVFVNPDTSVAVASFSDGTSLLVDPSSPRSLVAGRSAYFSTGLGPNTRADLFTPGTFAADPADISGVAIWADVAFQAGPALEPPARILDFGFVPSSVALADFDGDFFPDLVAAGPDGAGGGKLAVRLALPDDSGYGDPIVTDLPSVPRVVATGRFDDGITTDVTVGFGDEVRFFLGDGSGGLTAGTILTHADAAQTIPLRDIRSLAAGPLTNDGKDDLVLAVGKNGAAPGGVMFLPSDTGFRVVLGPGGGGGGVVAGNPCFQPLADLLVQRLAGDIAPAPETAANAALAILAADFEGDFDAVALAAVDAAGLLRKPFAGDDGVEAAVHALLGCAADDLRARVDSLIDVSLNTEDPGAARKSIKFFNRAEDLVLNAVDATTPSKRASFLRKALVQVEKGEKALVGHREGVTYFEGDLPWIADTVHSAYFAGAGNLVVTGTLPGGAGADEILTLAVSGFHGKGTYNLAGNIRILTSPNETLYTITEGTITLKKVSAVGKPVRGKFSFKAMGTAGTIVGKFGTIETVLTE
jgi:hypothetical protein